MTRAPSVEKALRLLLILTFALLTVTVVLTGGASSLYGQSGDSLQQKMTSQFVLTKITADRRDIIDPGTGVALLKFGLTLCSVNSPGPSLSIYKNGKLSGPSFGADLKNTVLKVPGKGTTADYPRRQFRTVERLWITGFAVDSDGLVVTLYSDPYDGIRYYGQLKFPFEKHFVPDANEVLRTFAEVLQKIDVLEVERVAGTYVGVGANQIQLKSDGTYSAAESGKSHDGPFLIQGNTLMLRVGTGVATCTLRDDAITDQAGSRWVKRVAAATVQKVTPAQDDPLRLPATYTNAQTPTDQLQLNADNSFLLQESGQTYKGTFGVKGNTIEITVAETQVKTRMAVQGNNLADPNGQVWLLREQPGPTTSAGSTLRNDDIIKLVKVGIDGAVIVAKITNSNCQFDTSTEALIQLKQAGVGAVVLKAIVGAKSMKPVASATNNARTTPLLPVRVISASQIRVRNSSGKDFRNVMVGGEEYGEIKAGATTGYRLWNVAYRYEPVSLMTDSGPMTIPSAIDHMGERTLGKGLFTYVLVIRDDRLVIDLEPGNE